MQRNFIKNVLGSVAIAAGLACLCLFTDKGFFHWRWPSCIDDSVYKIQKANESIGLLSVSEVVTKDVIYLRHKPGFIGKLKSGALCVAEKVSVPPTTVAFRWLTNRPVYYYEMDFDWGALFGHQGVIEYVIDVTKAHVRIDSCVSKSRIKIEVPPPRVDAKSLEVNKEKFTILKKGRMFSDGGDACKVYEKMEGIAKGGFRAGLQEIAHRDEYRQDAELSAKTALTAIYTKVAPNVEVEIVFDEKIEK